MAILARQSITLTFVRDIVSVTRYYKLQASTATAPSKPTSYPPSGWVTAEPAYAEDSTNTLYLVDCTEFSNGGHDYSEVSVSSSFEAAKTAYNKSVAAQNTATAAKDAVDNLSIGARNLWIVRDQVPGFLVSNLKSLGTSSSPNWPVCSDFIAVNEGEELTIQQWIPNNTATDPPQIFYGFYTAADMASPSGNRQTFTGEVGDTYLTTTIVVPTGAKYFRVSLRVFANPDVKIKVERGNKPTDWSPAPEDVSNDILEAVDGIEVGGRNLMLNTLTPSTVAANRPKLKGSTINSAGRGTATVAEHGIRFTNTTANWEYFRLGNASATNLDMLGLEPGETYTYSFDCDWKVFSGSPNPETEYVFGVFLYTLNEGDTGNHLRSVHVIHRYETSDLTDRGAEFTDVRVEATFTIPDTAKKVYIDVRGGQELGGTVAAHHAIGDYIELRNIKFEKGNKATDWTPAPEDVSAEINNAMTAANGKNKNYYQSENNPPSGSGFAVGDTWFVLDSDGNVDAVKQWDGTQWQTTEYTSGIFSAIDAGKITTGTLDAGAITVVNLNAGSIVTGRLESDDGNAWFDLDTGTLGVKNSANTLQTTFANGVLDFGGKVQTEGGSSLYTSYGSIGLVLDVNYEGDEETITGAFLRLTAVDGVEFMAKPIFTKPAYFMNCRQPVLAFGSTTQNISAGATSAFVANKTWMANKLSGATASVIDGTNTMVYAVNTNSDGNGVYVESVTYEPYNGGGGGVWRAHFRSPATAAASVTFAFIVFYWGPWG